MLPATPTIIALHAFETHFETATRDILTRAGLDQSFLSGDPSGQALPETRIETYFVLGSQSEDGLTAGGAIVPTGCTGALEVGIVTRREQDQPSVLPGVGRLHTEFAARARVALLTARDPFAGLVPYAISEIRPEQNERGLDDRFWEDFTRLRWIVRFSIPRGAWGGA